MIILGIDTSCDDTCISVLKIENRKLKILSNVVSSQVKLHAKYGGVYPFLAKREHQRNLPAVFKRAVKGLNIKKIDLVGVTNGPGLEPCLWQGINFAKDLARKIKKPLILVNHIEAHIVANWLSPICEIQNSKFKIQKTFPAICLVVSGGHTELILIKGIGKYGIISTSKGENDDISSSSYLRTRARNVIGRCYKLIGETRDDAAGECFDKSARILGLGYPGGPAIASNAAKFQNPDSKFKIKLPRPMMYTKDYDFSFSGLKTAVLYEFKKQPEKNKKSKIYIQEMCREIQQAIVDVLIRKTLKAAKDYAARAVILGGGVVANSELRKQFGEKIQKEISQVKYLTPDIKYCTDNAAMIALTAYFEQKKKLKNLEKIKVDANLKI